MFNFGFFELILLFVIIVVFVGPEQLPGVARNLLKLLNQWKQITNKVKEPLQSMQDDLTKSIKNGRDLLLKDADDIKDPASLDKK